MTLIFFSLVWTCLSMKLCSGSFGYSAMRSGPRHQDAEDAQGVHEARHHPPPRPAPWPAVTRPSTSTLARASLFDWKRAWPVTSTSRPSLYVAITRSCCVPLVSRIRSFGSTRTVVTDGASGSPNGMPAAIQPNDRVVFRRPTRMRVPPPWAMRPDILRTNRLISGAAGVRRRPRPLLHHRGEVGDGVEAEDAQLEAVLPTSGLTVAARGVARKATHQGDNVVLEVKLALFGAVLDADGDGVLAAVGLGR